MSKLSNLIKHVQAALNDSSKTDEIQRCEAFLADGANTKKLMVLKAICDRSHAIMTDDLPRVEEELMGYFEEFKNEDYFQDIHSDSYYRFLDMRDNRDARVVVIGDIHCDYYSLASIMLKLSVSSYDYFEKAHFVFLGDYLDRGSSVFEPLLLLMDLKRILGERMIMLRGNHELISYQEEQQELESRVIPQDTCPILNEYCSGNKEFLKAFGFFYKTLPTYVYLKVADQNILLTHAAVPRQIFLDQFKYNQETGAINFETRFLYEQNNVALQRTSDDSLTSMTTILNTNLLNVRNKILYDMIWGDPSSDKEKYQVSGRYQFGSMQFDAYAQKNKLSRLFRSHEPVSEGYKAFFDNRLYTIFSTGGSMNEQAGYGDINPAFAVIKGDGDYFLENSFIYYTELCGTFGIVCNPFSGEILNIKHSNKCTINEEFFCSEDDALKVEAVFAKLKEGFFVPDDSDEEMEAQAETSAADDPKPEPTIEPEPAPEEEQKSNLTLDELPTTE